MKVIRAVQWTFLLASFGWLLINLKFAAFLVKAFPTSQAADFDITKFPSNAQFLRIIFGPLIVSLIFAMIKFPSHTSASNKLDT